MNTLIIGNKKFTGSHTYLFYCMHHFRMNYRISVPTFWGNLDILYIFIHSVVAMLCNAMHFVFYVPMYTRKWQLN